MTYGISVFQEALAEKHEQLAAFLNKDFSRSFQCQCNKIVLASLPSSQICSSGSTGDISTTETNKGVNLETASHLAVSDDITSSISYTNSNNSSKNIPKPLTADWIVNAPFHYDSEYPDLETPLPWATATLGPLQPSQTKSGKLANEFKLESTSGRNISNNQLFTLQNIGTQIFEPVTIKEGRFTEPKQDADASFNSDFTISSDTKMDSVACSSEFDASNQTYNEGAMCDEFKIDREQNKKDVSQHKKKKKRKGRKRNKSEPNTSKLISDTGNQNVSPDLNQEQRQSISILVIIAKISRLQKRQNVF